MRIRDAAELTTLGAIWGASFLLMRIAAPAFGPIALIQVRVSVAAVVLLVFLLARGEGKSLLQHCRPFLVVGFLNSAFPFTLFAYATLSLEAGLAAVLNATVPWFAALIAWGWFRERPSGNRVVGLGIGFVGVVVLVFDSIGLKATSNQSSAVAIAACLIAACSYAIAAHFSKRAFQGVPPLTISTGNLLAASVMLLPLQFWAWPSHLPEGKAWGCAIALGILCTGVAYVLFFRLVNSIGPSQAMVVTYLIPFFAILWGAIWLGETITWRKLFGGAVVLLGTILINRSPAIPQVPLDPEPAKKTL